MKRVKGVEDLNIRIVRAQGIVGVGVTTRMFIAWSAAAGISEDANTWHPARRKFLLPIKALAKLVRGKFRALLRRKLP